MKTKFLFLAVVFTTMIFGQSLSLTENTTLPLQGGNCGNGNKTQLTFQYVNLNGYNLELRNVDLNVTQNINGPGSITTCGNQNNSSICYSGALQNNANLNGITCSSLSTPTFNIQRDLGIKYAIYNINSQLIKEGYTVLDMFNDLPKNQILFLHVEGFKIEKKHF